MISLYLPSAVQRKALITHTWEQVAHVGRRATAHLARASVRLDALRRAQNYGTDEESASLQIPDVVQVRVAQALEEGCR